MSNLDKIKKLVLESKPDGIVTKLRHIPEYWVEIESYLKNNSFYSKSEQVYCFINQYVEKPKCICDNPLTFISITSGYREFCSASCVHAKKAALDRRVAKMKENGGVGLANPKTRAKARKSLQKLHGSDVINPGQIKSHKENMTINNPMKLAINKEKLKNANLKKYGVDNPSKIHYSIDTINTLNDIDQMNLLFKSMPISDISHNLGVSDGVVLRKLIEYGIRVPYQSSPELQLSEFLISLGADDFKKDRTILGGKEIDLYSPSLKIGIEYCGLYYHSESIHSDRNYHKNKYSQCKNLGIKLITIFEDEWIHRPSIVLSRIRHLINKSDTGVGARKLLIKEIDNIDAKRFLDVYHLSGYANTYIKYGAYHDSTLVAVMTFGKNNRSNSGELLHEWEMVRFATNGKNYPGVAGKLLSAFIKQYSPSSILSYSNLRYGEGDYLKNLGFVRNIKDTEKGYWYFKNNEYKLYHRSNFTKSNIIKKFPHLDFSSLTDEYSMAKHAGLDRIWDCGNAVWVWNKS